jgi:hypothetical protein
LNLLQSAGPHPSRESPLQNEPKLECSTLAKGQPLLP